MNPNDNRLPLASDVFSNARIGLWAIEMDEGKAPRMYLNKMMYQILGLDDSLTPEDTYAFWYSHADAKANELIRDSLDRMITGQHAEVQFLWHHPEGKTVMLRFAGQKNRTYQGGVRIEGGQEDITDLIHFDVEKKEQEITDLSLLILSSLYDSYAALYYVSAETGAYRLITRDEDFSKKIDRSFVNTNNFFADCKENILRSIIEEDLPKFGPLTSREQMEEALNESDHFEVDYRIDFDGVPIWYSTKAVKIYDREKRPHYAIGVRRIEDQRTKEFELMRSTLREKALNFIYEHGPDLDLFMVFFGNSILELSGCDQITFRTMDGKRYIFTAENTEGLSEHDCDGCPFADPELSFYNDGFVQMNDCRKGFRGVLPKENCHARSTFSQQVFSAGEPAGLLSFYFVNTQHSFRKSETDFMISMTEDLGFLLGRLDLKRLEIAQIRAETSNNAKTEFLFNMSHDIRTPMNAILGYTEIALHHEDDPLRVHDSLEKIKTSGGHLLELINDILEMSRIEAGKLELINAPLNMYDVVKSVSQMVKALAFTKDIHFRTVFGELKNPYIYADELHINQVLINVISNAIKYTPAGGHVEYRVEQVSEAVNGIAKFRLTISDDGIGMSREFQKHLFENFSRENNATMSGQEGTGLGLSIVKKILDLAGGTIKVLSEKGQGSVFTINLPFRVMEEDAIEAYKNASGKTDELISKIRFDGEKLLVVEDNALNREIIEEILTDAGANVELAEDGAIALKKVKEKGISYYDCILMDIQMPVMNGYEATGEIRKLPGGAAVPIIALSANAFREDIEKSLSYGMNAHIAKPVKIPELLSLLSKFL